MMKIITGVIDQICPTLLMENEEFLTMLEGNHYDIAVLDAFFMYKCIYLIPHRLGIPVVSLVDEFEPWLARLPWFPSFVPSPMLGFSDNMRFHERLLNSALLFLFYLIPPYSPVPADIMQKYQEYGAVAHIDDLVTKSELWLLNSDPTLAYTVPLFPNVVQVGGLTASPAKALSTDLQAKIAAFPKGFVLVSFGSSVSSLPGHLTDKVIHVLGKLDLLVIWRDQRTEDSMGNPIPDNIHMMKWLPQNDLLGDKNAQAFVTHCGKNGLYESLYHGVPIVGVPLWGDQPHNAKVVENMGYGESVDLFTCTEDDFERALMKVLQDPSYKANITLGSKRFHGRPDTPAQRAALWTEHVLEFGGSHLRSHAYELTWYQYFCLDILLTVLVVIVLLMVILWKLLRCTYYLCCRSSKKEKKS